MIVNSRTLNKIISRSESLQRTLLDLTEDTVDETNLSRGETAHDKEGDGVVGRFQIDDAEAWAIGTRNGVLVGEDDITYHNNSKYYSQMSEAAAAVSGSAMMVAGSYADAAELSALASADSALMSENYEIISGSYMSITGSYMNVAGERAEDSEAFAMGKRGGALVPPSDPTYHNNSKYYYEQSKSIAESLVGVLRPKGTCLFADLPLIADSQSGDLWNIEDEFTTTSDFREGAGRVVAAGSDVYLTVDLKWDILAGVTSDYIGATSSTAAIHGLMPAAQPGEQDKVIFGDGRWKNLPVFRGVSGSVESTSGMLPAAQPGDEKKAFCGDGTFKNIIDMIYPINSVYISMINTNPSTYWTGTTWELLSDGYLRNNATDATGGSLTSGSTTLTKEQIPSHSHTITTDTHAGHTHTATTENTGAHTHTATTENTGAHTHTATTGSYGNHTHTVQEATSSGGTAYLRDITNIAGGGGSVTVAGSYGSAGYVTNSKGAHTHTLTTGSYGKHTHTLTTGSYGKHTHTLTTGKYGSHSHTGTTQAIGGGQGHTHSIEPTYTRVYAFKRTA